MMIQFSCSQCGKGFKVVDEWAGKRAKCKACGGAIQIPALEPELELQELQDNGFADSVLVPRKSRLTYILLAIFLGGFGAHNHYAGYTKRGIAQFSIILFGFWLIVPLLAVSVWIWYEVFTVTHDADGIPFDDGSGFPAVRPASTTRMVVVSRNLTTPPTMKSCVLKPSVIKPCTPGKAGKAIKIVSVILLAFMACTIVAAIVSPHNVASNADNALRKTNDQKNVSQNKRRQNASGGSLQYRYDRIQVGMTETEMLKIMGDDYKIVSDAESQVPGIKLRMKTYQWGGLFGLVHICTENGQVSQKVKP